MILDCLKNSARYNNVNPLFSKAFEYLKSLDFNKLEVGKTILIEGELFVMVSDTTLKKTEEAKYELHNKYIDIQLPITAIERFGWGARENVKEQLDVFNTEKDVQFFNDKPETYFDVHPGSFAIFFPEDVHAPCIGQGDIRKIVVKVLVK